MHIPLLLFFTDKSISKQFLQDKKYDLVLIFKGRGIGVRLIKKINQVSKKVIGYTWDSFKHTSAPLRWYKHITKFYTPEYFDAEKYSLPILELYSSLSSNKKEKEIRYDISAILKNYPGRLSYIDKIFNVLKPERKYIYIYEQNILYFFFNFVRSPILYIKYRKNIYFKPIPYEEYFKIVELSEFTLDYAHRKQTSVAMRCFEVLGANTKIISNNNYLKSSQYFDNSNSVIFSEKDIEFFEMCYKKCKSTKSIHVVRNINNFINELIGEE